MTRIVVDEELRNKLHNFAQPLELCDGSGQILARLVPSLDTTQFEPCEPAISEEELRRREQSNKWHTTSEVLAHLDRLVKDQENS